MKTTKKLLPIIKFLPLLVAITVQASEPVESGAGRICATLKTFQGEVQIFDSTRTHLGDAAFGTKLRCGDWISVEKGKAILEHFSGAALAIADRSFVQVLDPQSGEATDHSQFTLYRGEMLVSAPSAHGKEKTEIRIATPNAMIRVSNGDAYVLYSTSAEESQAIGLGGKVSLENRFFQEKSMTAGFAQFVAFSNPSERLVPEQARYVNAADLNDRLSKIGIPVAVREAVEKATKLGAKTKMPVSLAVSTPKFGVSTGEFRATTRGSSIPTRAPASVGSTRPPLVTHRGPASVAKRTLRANAKANEPDFRLKREVSEDQEKKRLLQALSSMRSEEE